MATASTFKKTVKNETVHPFALASANPWRRIHYRFDEAEPWKNALLSSFIVLPSNREDVRKDVLHSFDIEVDTTAIVEEGWDLKDIDLIVLSRDPFAKKILIFHQSSLSEASTVALSIPRAELEHTSMFARLQFQVMLVAKHDTSSNGREIRRSGRLATHTLTISAEKKGHSFNFAKTSAEDFKARGLPGSTTFYIEVPRRQDLVEACDDVASVLSVLVHEDVWPTLQEIRAGDRIGEALGSMFLAEVIFGVLLLSSEVLIKENLELDDASVAKRLLGWIAEKSGEPIQHLEELMRDEDGHLKLQALAQDTIRLTPTIHRVRLDVEEAA